MHPRMIKPPQKTQTGVKSECDPKTPRPNQQKASV